MLALMLLAQTASAAMLPQPRIIGGYNAAPGQWPATVALYLKLDNSARYRFCAGTLVAPGWVLTAAHCFFNSAGAQDVSAGNIDVLAGSQDLSEPGQRGYLQVQNLLLHPQYRQQSLFDYDAALLELTYPVENVKPMPRLAGEAAADEAALVAGWGVSEVNSGSGKPVAGSFSDTLQQAQIKIVSREVCQQAMAYPLTDAMLCAGWPVGGRDSCSGDSGGPLVVERDGDTHQVGIVSFGDGCGKPGSYGVYTRLTAINEWVSELTGSLSETTRSEPNITAVDSAAFVREVEQSPDSTTAARSGGGGILWLPILLLTAGALRLSKTVAFRETDSTRR